MAATRRDRRSLPELAREHGINLRTLKSRLERGLSIEEALSMPTRSYPDHVLRPREPKHKPMPASEVASAITPRCDRCRQPGRVLSVFGGSWQLCYACRGQLAQIAANWISAKQ